MIKDFSKYFKDLYVDENDIVELIKIMNDYCFIDLLSAVYCINICVNNRSALVSQMKLNLSLCLCDKNGIKEIKKYYEFKEFYNRLKPFIKINEYDDSILEDFSDIKFKFNGKLYNVIVGTGYNSSYAQLYFLEPLSLYLSKQTEFTEILKYNSDIIDYFKEFNITDNKEKIRIICPSNMLFKRVRKFFKELDFEKTKYLFSLIKSENEYIEKKHFIYFKGIYYPLYNTSILIDLFDLYYSKLNDEEKNKIADNGIYYVLNSITSIDKSDNPMVYFPIKLYEGSFEQETPTFTFLARTSKGNSIIAINKSEFDEEELEEIISKLKEYKKDSDLKFIEIRRKSSKGYHGLTITNKSDLKIILYDNYINLSESSYILRGECEKNIIECNALDVIYMLLFSSGFDEIESYIDYNDQEEYDQIIGYGGDSCRFFTWKSMNHMIAKGAVRFGMINTDINTADGFVLDYYRNDINFFPWESTNIFLFGNPFSWNIEKYDNDVYFLKNKIVNTFSGYVKVFNNNQLIFFAQNLLFWDKNNIDKLDQITSIIDDIVLRKLKTCFEYFQNISNASSKSIYFLFAPYEYAENIGIDNSDSDRIVFGDCIEDDLSLNIRYTINYDLLYKRISESSDRRVENRFIKELFEPIKEYYPEEIVELNKYLDSTSSDKKEVETIQIELDYMVTNSFRKYHVDDYSYLKVKKIIAEICYKNDIEPGEYFGTDANNLIRKMQKELIQKFEKMISKYDQLDLHIKLLEMYSNSIHEIYIHKKRYSMVNNVTDEVLNDVRNNIIEQRETSKRNSRTLLYLIESNLFIERRNTKIIDDETLKMLLAFSHWMVNLNDTADICYFTDKEAHIIVNYEYVIDNEVNSEIDEKEYTKRVYSNNNYQYAHDSSDSIYIDKVLSVFKSETGCDLKGIFDICYYLQMEFLQFDYLKLDYNVYRISKESLINNLYNIVNGSDEEKYTKKQIETNLNLLIINPKELKTRKGKQDFFIPFNDRENRDNRFEIKPIIFESNDLIFSPALMKNVHSLWFDGLLNFMLPYEIGIPETRKMLLEWKKVYEDKMVYDIKNIFLTNDVSFVKINVQLHKIDRQENYPIDIGDFDVIAIDDVNKKIWIIESKFLSLVANFYEMFEQQKNFFKKGKYIEKFQRRIDYMNQNYKRILKSFGFIDVTNYEVLSYMVFNKVIISRYRKIDFPLISITELENEIKKTIV